MMFGFSQKSSRRGGADAAAQTLNEQSFLQQHFLIDGKQKKKKSYSPFLCDQNRKKTSFLNRSFSMDPKATTVHF